MNKSYSYDSFLFGFGYYPEPGPEPQSAFALYTISPPAIELRHQLHNAPSPPRDCSSAAGTSAGVRGSGEAAYRTLQGLTQAWAARVSPQPYTPWDEPWLPRPTRPCQNPSLLLDFLPFPSD